MISEQPSERRSISRYWLLLPLNAADFGLEPASSSQGKAIERGDGIKAANNKTGRIRLMQGHRF